MAQTINQQMNVDGQSTDMKDRSDSCSLPSTSKMDYEHSGNENKKKNSSERRISSQDITAFCDRLEEFVTHAQKYRKNASRYPMTLQERLNNDIKNLEFLLIETQDTVRSIQKMKTQHKFVKKDSANTEKLLKKFKQEEVRAIEDQILKCDANMYKIWETLRKSSNIEMVEKFAEELQEKLIALERLKELVNQKLTELQLTPIPLMIQFNSSIRPKEKSVKSLTYETRKLTRPVSGNKKRKHLDQNDVYISIQESVSLPPQLPPPLLINSPLALVLNNNSSISYNMSESTEITASSQSLTNTASSAYDDTESAIRVDMQSVLNALFGDVRQGTEFTDATQGGQANITSSSDGFDIFKDDYL